MDGPKTYRDNAAPEQPKAWLDGQWLCGAGGQRVLCSEVAAIANDWVNDRAVAYLRSGIEVAFMHMSSESLYGLVRMADVGTAVGTELDEEADGCEKTPLRRA